MEAIHALVMRIIAAGLVLVVGYYLSRLARDLIRGRLSKTSIDATLSSFLVNLAYAALLTFVIIAALSKLGIQTASFIAVLGAAGLAVGLALQGSLSNFAAGVMILIFKPFKAGDFIQGAGTSGIVENLNIFHTEMRTPDNKKVIVPNAKMTGDNIINFTANDQRRMDLVVGVSYGDDIDKVKSVLQEIIDADERILKDPPPTIGLLEMADSSLNFAVRPWVKTAEYWDVFFATQEAIKKRLDEEGITIPFPQRDVHLYEEKPSK